MSRRELLLRYVARTPRRPPDRVARTFITAALLALAWPVHAQAASRTVLVLYSNSRLLPANVEVNQGLRQTIVATVEAPVQVFDEFLDVPRFRGKAYSQLFARYLTLKYGSWPPDVIVAAGEGALTFVLQSRAKLFPDVPIVHVAVATSVLRSLPALPADVLGIPVQYGYFETMEQALTLQPSARRLVIVTGASAQDHVFEGEMHAAAARIGRRAEIEFLSGAPTERVLERLRELGKDTVVVTSGYFEDGAGHDTTPREAVEGMLAVSGAPLYAPFSTFLGTGIVGGTMPSFVEMGQGAGRLVNGVLSGARPSSLHTPEVTPTALHLDWRQVRRWGIDERLVPQDAVIHFRVPRFAEQHRTGIILVLGGFVLETALIASLLFERRRRHDAENALQGQRSELTRVSRLAIAGELTASIAHEMNQPLGAILSNAEAADLVLQSGAESRDKVREILADIRRDDLRASNVIRRLRSLFSRHQEERQPIDLNEVAAEAEAVLRAEVGRRRMGLDLHPAASKVTVVADRIELQQVLINLALNAMDAVAALPEHRRAIVVSVEERAGKARIAVRDRGDGIAAENLPRLFESFFSTKPEGMGMGLSIARSLVEANGGRIWAENGPDDGAVFQVEFDALDDTGAAGGHQ